MIAARDSLLARLRRSVLGAWLACAYALAVLAAALSPVPALAFGMEPGAVLCSGAPIPDDGGNGAPSAPLGDLGHCKGCSHNPVLAAPPVLAVGIAMRQAHDLAPLPFVSASLPQGSVRGLPRSRAPPLA